MTCVDLLFAKYDCEPTTQNNVSNITENISVLDNSIKQNIQQDCIADTKGGNLVKITGSVVTNFTSNQKNIIKNTCALKSAFKSNVNSDVQDKVANGIAQVVESKGAVIASSSGNTTNNITNLNSKKSFIDNSQVLNSVKRCINKLEVGNVIDIENSYVNGATIDQVGESFIDCLASDDATSTIANALKSDTENKTDQTAKAEGGNLVSSFFNGISSVIKSYSSSFIAIAIALIIVCVISSGLSAYFSMSDSKVAVSGRQNLGSAFDKYQAMQGMQNMKSIPVSPPSYDNFEFLGSMAKRLPIPGLYKK
jgi:hypothetical protein